MTVHLDLTHLESLDSLCLVIGLELPDSFVVFNLKIHAISGFLSTIECKLNSQVFDFKVSLDYK